MLKGVETSVAVWTALGHQQAPFDGAALVALRYVALAGFGPYQARPQHAPLVGAALVALARSGHQQAHGWAALMTPVHQSCWSCWHDSGQVSGLALDWIHTCNGIISVKEVAEF